MSLLDDTVKRNREYVQLLLYYLATLPFGRSLPQRARRNAMVGTVCSAWPADRGYAAGPPPSARSPRNQFPQLHTGLVLKILSGFRL